MRKIASAILTLFMIIGISLSSLLVPQQAFAQTESWTGGCVKSVQFGDETADIATIEGFECVVTNLLSIATSIIGIASFIMLLIGGFTFLLSGGTPKHIETGKKTMGFAIVGIVVAISAWVILRFVSVFTGVGTVTTFDVNPEQTQNP